MLLLPLLLPVSSRPPATATKSRKREPSLTWNTSWDDDNVRILERLGHAAIGWEVALDLGDGGNVRQIRRDTWGVHDIVEGELVDERAGLEEERQRLTDTARGTCDDYSMVQHTLAMDAITTSPMVQLVMDC